MSLSKIITTLRPLRALLGDIGGREITFAPKTRLGSSIEMLSSWSSRKSTRAVHSARARRKRAIYRLGSTNTGAIVHSSKDICLQQLIHIIADIVVAPVHPHTGPVHVAGHPHTYVAGWETREGEPPSTTLARMDWPSCSRKGQACHGHAWHPHRAEIAPEGHCLPVPVRRIPCP